MIYDILLSFFVLGSLPKILKKKQKFLLSERFGNDPPVAKEGRRRIWIHGVSVGEIKAAKPLVELLYKEEPSIQILITTATQTGLDEAKRSLSKADLFRIFPLDFSWIMKRWIGSFRPDQLIFIEGDLWPNLMSIAQKKDVQTALVSGKLSERSFRRLSWFRPLARRLYGSLDTLCVQSEEHAMRFQMLLGKKTHITGNLKLDASVSPIDRKQARELFSLHSKQIAITISCTHDPEEEELIDSLLPLFITHPDLVLLLAPRHPHRFEKVADILREKKLSFCKFGDTRTEESVVLIDQMGRLGVCYAASAIAIIGGSFSSKKGGHNLFEPCLYSCPVFFGPHIHLQKEISSLILHHHLGCSVSSSELADQIKQQLPFLKEFRERILSKSNQFQGCSKKTLELLLKKRGSCDGKNRR